MANHKSAKKRARQTIKRTERNRPVKTYIKSCTRAFRAALTTGNMEEAGKLLAVATRTLRKAASKGVIPKQTASRRVSRLSVAFNNTSK